MQKVSFSEDPDPVGGDAQLLPCFPQGAGGGGFPAFHASAGEAHLAAVVLQRGGTHLIQQVQTVRLLQQGEQNGVFAASLLQRGHMAAIVSFNGAEIHGKHLLFI